MYGIQLYQFCDFSLTGYFLAFQTIYSSPGGLLNSPRENTTSQSCLKFFTFGNRDLTVLIRRNGNLIQVSVPAINTSTIWRPVQVCKLRDCLTLSYQNYKTIITEVSSKVTQKCAVYISKCTVFKSIFVRCLNVPYSESQLFICSVHLS